MAINNPDLMAGVVYGALGRIDSGHTPGRPLLMLRINSPCSRPSGFARLRLRCGAQTPVGRLSNPGEVLTSVVDHKKTPT